MPVVRKRRGLWLKLNLGSLDMVHSDFRKEEFLPIYGSDLWLKLLPSVNVTILLSVNTTYIMSKDSF